MSRSFLHRGSDPGTCFERQRSVMLWVVLVLALCGGLLSACGDEQVSLGMVDAVFAGEEPASEEVPGRTFAEDLCDTPVDVLELELVTVAVSGTLNIDGVSASNLASGTSMVLVDVEAENRYAVTDFDPSDGAFSTEVFAGRYDVFVNFNNGHARFQNVVKADAYLGTFELDRSQSLDLELDLVPFEGTLQINEQSPGDLSQDWAQLGWVGFRSADTKTEWRVRLGSDDRSEISVLVPKGHVYDMVWEVPMQQEWRESDLPFGRASLGRFDAQGPGSLQANVRSVMVEGDVTVDGASLPNDTSLEGIERGSVIVRCTECTSPPIYRSLGERGPGRYAVHLLEGAYEIEVRTNGSWHQTALPDSQTIEICGGATMPCLFQEDTRLDLAPWDNIVPLDVWVSGSLDVQGPDLKPDDGDIGSLLFYSVANGAPVWADVKENGEFQALLGREEYMVVFWAGSWRQYFGSVVLEESFTPTENVENQRWDVQTVTFTGEVLRNGARVTDEGARGSLELVSTLVPDRVYLPLEESGAATFEVVLVEGGFTARIVNRNVDSSGHGLELMVGAENALPVGVKELGLLEIVSQDRTNRMEQLFDLTVQRVQGTLRQRNAASELLPEAPYGMLRLESEEGHEFLANVGPEGGLDFLLYEGSYHIALQEYPQVRSYVRPFASLGSICVVP